jgi:hypothetical protein
MSLFNWKDLNLERPMISVAGMIRHNKVCAMANKYPELGKAMAEGKPLYFYLLKLAEGKRRDKALERKLLEIT